MASRRMGRPDASIRFDLLDATERVLARDGYAAVTSRNVGNEAGVTQKLVYYYFQNMEELIVATFRRRSEVFLNSMEAALRSETPMRCLWELSSDRNARLVIEFMAMATRSTALHDEIARYNARANQLQEAVLAGHLRPGIRRQGIFTPRLVCFMIASLARNLVLESELGLIAAPGEIRSLIERLLDSLESASSGD